MGLSFYSTGIMCRQFLYHLYKIDPDYNWLCIIYMFVKLVLCLRDLSLLWGRRERIRAPPWTFASAYPESWMILSHVMIKTDLIYYFRIGFYGSCREMDWRTCEPIDTLFTGRYGLGPKPGSDLWWLCIDVYILACRALMKPLIYIRILVFNIPMHIGGTLLWWLHRRAFKLFYNIVGLWLFCCNVDGLQRQTVPRAPPSPNYYRFEHEPNNQDEREYRPPLPSSVHSHEHFKFMIQLESDLPKAMHAHLSHSHFDDRFVAMLASRRKEDNQIIEIILDTGSTHCITPHRDDFFEYQAGDYGEVKTVNGPTRIAGVGKVRWTLISENGEEATIVVPCHHIPGADVRLLSPQDYALYHGLDRREIQYGGSQSFFFFNYGHLKHEVIQCPIDARCHLPIVMG